MNITIVFADGLHYEFPCADKQSILEAALTANVPLMSQCQSGSCGTCVAKLIHGEAPMLAGVSLSLLKSEREAGLRLTCQCVANGDCEFAVDYESAMGEVLPERYESNIEALQWVANDVVRLTLRLPDDDWFAFEAGQFAQVRVPGTDTWRSYSMASGVREMPALDLYIRILEKGVMSDYLKGDAEIGDLVELEGPFGTFRLRKSKAPHLFIAGGTGLAPFLSMLEAIRVYSGTKPPVLLSFGTANDAGLFCLQELEDAAYMLPNLRYRISVDQQLDPNSAALIGNPVTAITTSDVESKDCVAYLCGPPAMIAAGRDHLIKCGIQPENIFAEQFVPTS